MRFYNKPGEDGFDGISIGASITAELSKKVGSDVTHFKLLSSTKRV